MANKGRWGALGSVVNLLTTGLNSLANGNACTESSAWDNTSGKYAFVSFDLLLASLTPSTGGYVTIIGWASLDGTNYGAPIVSSNPPSTAEATLRWSGNLNASTAAQRIITPPLIVLPVKYKFQVVNGSGVALASSGNTLDLYPLELDLNA